jgi:hypothetical protein
MSVITDFMSQEGITPMPELDQPIAHTPASLHYVIRHDHGGLCWHTPQGSHYADVMEVNRMMAAGEQIRPMPIPGALMGDGDDIWPEANVVRDADCMVVGLVEYIGPTHYISQWHEVHRLLCGEIDEAALLPISAGEFRELI